jgi:hypothetical protein
MRPTTRSRKIIRSGVPLGRTGDALNDGLLPVEDARHRVGGLLPYEWWYFDASFDNGYSAVAIIWPMNYAKPWRRQCTLQLSIYTPDGDSTKHYIFPPSRLFDASFERCDARIGDGHVRGEHPRYEVRMRVGDDAVDLVFEAETPGWKPGTAVNYLPVPRYKSMGWLVPVPRARVSGSIVFRGREIPVSGHGYHDHNWGETLITHYVDNWHWGHIVCGEISLIWSDITMAKSLGCEHIYMFLLGRGDRLAYESAELRVAYSDWYEDSLYLHPYPRRVEVAFGRQGDVSHGRVIMLVQSVVETQNLLDMVGVPARAQPLIHKAFGKPYYFRWRSNVEGFVEIEGERFPLGGTTIHEQMLFRGRRPALDASLSGARH